MNDYPLTLISRPVADISIFSCGPGAIPEGLGTGAVTVGGGFTKLLAASLTWDNCD